MVVCWVLPKCLGCAGVRVCGFTGLRVRVGRVFGAVPPPPPLFLCQTEGWGGGGLGKDTQGPRGIISATPLRWAEACRIAPFLRLPCTVPASFRKRFAPFVHCSPHPCPPSQTRQKMCTILKPFEKAGVPDIQQFFITVACHFYL